jgi:RNA-directed DNA polymerase
MSRIREPKDLAAQTAGSPQGPWRIAYSPALNIALPASYLAQLGLPPMVVRS